MSNVPPLLTREIRATLTEHARRHHSDVDPEIFAASFADRLLGQETQAAAARAVAALDIEELPRVSAGADETYRLAGVLREALCRGIRDWLLHAGTFRYNSETRSLAYARAIAGAADAGTYMAALHNAKSGRLPRPPHDGLSAHERAAYEVEARYNEGWRR